MGPNDEPATFDPKAPGGEGRKSRTSPATDQPARPNLMAFTVDAETGRVVKVEAVDPGGARQELSEDARSALTKGESKPTLEAIVEQAFEAGIDCVLGQQDTEAEGPESEEDADLRRMLLRSLIAHSAARRLVQREVLGRAMVGTLIQQAAGARGAKPEAGAAH